LILLIVPLGDGEELCAMKTIFAVLLILHGLIHLPGFVKTWWPSALEKFSMRTIIPLSDQTLKWLSFPWLIAGLLFIFSALLLLFQRGQWLGVTLAAVLLSMILILLFWPDAKAGILPTLAILVVWFFVRADRSFTRESERLVKTNSVAVLPAQSSEELAAKFEQVPLVVQKWLRRSGAGQFRPVQTALIEQKGRMLTKPGGSWIPFEPSQFISTNPPCFLWDARIRAFPAVTIYGRDQLLDGHGRMLIRAMGLFTLTNAAGREINQGTLLRYLGVIAWYPTAALSDRINWKGLTDSTARATLLVRETAVSGIFTFNSMGDMVRFEADRYFLENKTYQLRKWLIELNKHASPAGLRIPMQATVSWVLPESRFTWLTLELNTVQYNL
jgi:hypothetical protein